VGLFKQFETLRFKEVASREVGVPKLNISYLLVVALAFIGMQLTFGLLAGFVLISFFFPTPESLLDLLLSAVSSPWTFASLVAFVAIGHFLSGMLTGRAALEVAGVTYTYVVLGSFIASSISVLPLFAQAISRRSTEPLEGFASPYFALWLLYIVTAFLGARLAIRKRRGHTTGGES
jgi:hypothetical protein